jgi:hypothetical protein
MDKTRDRFDHHLPYEVDMLVRTYAFLRGVKPDTNPLLINVFVEAFCVHARVLMEFLECHAHKFAIAGYRRVSRKDDPEFEQFWVPLNKQIMHLDPEGRYIDPSKKIEAALQLSLNNWLSVELERFKANLKPEYATPVLQQIPKFKMIIVGSGNATTTTSSIDVVTFSPAR